MENEKKFYYKSFLRTMYALFGIFMALNGFFVFKNMIKMQSNQKIIGGLMFVIGIMALLLFYFYTKVPYAALMGKSKLKYKPHPLYNEKIITKDYVKSVTETREKIYRIVYTDNSGSENAVVINASLVDNDKQLELISIIKSFSPDSKDSEHNTENE